MSDDRHIAPGAAAGQRFAGTEGCAESRLLMSRRGVLGLSAGLFSSAFLPRSVMAAAGSDPRLLVVVMRGGMDGMTAVVPYGDPDYARKRNQLTINTQLLLKLRGSTFFGLHPALANLQNMYNDGDAAILHQVAPPLRTRSHFDCQRNLENGQPLSDALRSTSDGWLNRLLVELDSTAPVKNPGGRAIEIGQSPLLLRGKEKVLGWTASAVDHLDKPYPFLVETMYKKTDQALYQNYLSGLKGRALAEDGVEPPPGTSVLKLSFQGAARLFSTSDGPRIAVINSGGWDSHTDELPIVAGVLSDKKGVYPFLTDLDQSLAAFKAAISASAWKQTVVLLVSEFGRAVHNNGNLGADHGTGGAALMVGGAVRGKQVVRGGQWRSLQFLHEDRDNWAETDMRALFKGVLREHLDLPDAAMARVFPGSEDVAPLSGLIEGA